MRLFGLIGNPLAQSFSKKYFSAKFEREGINDCRYELFELPTIDDLPRLLADEPQLQGLNVTIPYKKLVIPYLDDLDEDCAVIQACNCIRFTGGRLIGYNTDATGFEKTFVPQLQPIHDKVLILGKGGATAAIEFVIRRLGLEFATVSRTLNTGADFTYDQLDGDMISEYKVIINTTPLGSFPAVDACPDIPYGFISSSHYLYDVVYNPAESLFLKKGKARGAVTMNGYDWLIVQAEESWKIWNS